MLYIVNRRLTVIKEMMAVKLEHVSVRNLAPARRHLPRKGCSVDAVDHEDTNDGIAPD